MTLLDQRQRHDIGRARHGNMAALSKLAEPVIKNVADFIKSFSDKTYYHFSPRPDIEKFDPKADPSFEDASGFGGRLCKGWRQSQTCNFRRPKHEDQKEPERSQEQLPLPSQL